MKAIHLASVGNRREISSCHTKNTEIPINPVLGYDIPPLHFIEDGMVVDSMPPVADRENENLGPTIDDGIIKLRQMYLREIEKVKRGEDPKAIVRDPEKNKMIVIPAYEKWVPESERQVAKSMAVG